MGERLLETIEERLTAQRREHFVVYATPEEGALGQVVRVAQALDRPLYIHMYYVGHPFHMDIARWTPLESGLCHCCTNLGNALQARDTVVVLDMGMSMAEVPEDVFEVLDRLHFTRKLSFNAAEGSHVVRLGEGVQIVLLLTSRQLLMPEAAPYRLYARESRIKKDGNGIKVAHPDNGNRGEL